MVVYGSSWFKTRHDSINVLYYVGEIITQDYHLVREYSDNPTL